MQPLIATEFHILLICPHLGTARSLAPLPISPCYPSLKDFLSCIINLWEDPWTRFHSCIFPVPSTPASAKYTIPNAYHSSIPLSAISIHFHLSYMSLNPSFISNATRVVVSVRMHLTHHGQLSHCSHGVVPPLHFLPRLGITWRNAGANSSLTRWSWSITSCLPHVCLFIHSVSQFIYNFYNFSIFVIIQAAPTPRFF